MRKRHGLILFVLMMCLFAAVPAQADWVQTKSGGYVYTTPKGARRKTVWYKSKNLGMVTMADGTVRCIKLDGSYYNGILKYKDRYYYFNVNGKLVFNKWIKGTSGKVYHTDSKGRLLTNRTVKIGDSRYGFSQRGELLIGLKKVGEKTYYFKRDGKMAVKQLVRIGGKLYWFGADGQMAVSSWVGRYYFGADGAALTETWKDYRYLRADAKFAVGLTKIGSNTFYFDEKTGIVVTNASRTVNGKTYNFGSDGKAKTVKSGNYESQYYSDPVVSDEVLLSAIIYCEAGNQPLYGQIAVGLVITNRMRSSQFPDTLKEVIYAKQQFEPARNGSLTSALKNQSKITQSCKNAAKVVLAALPLNRYDTKNDQGKTISLKGYYFFMTPAAYQRLGLHSSYIRLKDHVFFKNWVR